MWMKRNVGNEMSGTTERNASRPTSPLTQRVLLIA